MNILSELKKERAFKDLFADYFKLIKSTFFHFSINFILLALPLSWFISFLLIDKGPIVLKKIILFYFNRHFNEYLIYTILSLPLIIAAYCIQLALCILFFSIYSVEYMLLLELRKSKNFNIMHVLVNSIKHLPNYFSFLLLVILGFPILVLIFGILSCIPFSFIFIIPFLLLFFNSTVINSITNKKGLFQSFFSILKFLKTQSLSNLFAGFLILVIFFTFEILFFNFFPNLFSSLGLSYEPSSVHKNIEKLSYLRIIPLGIVVIYIANFINQFFILQYFSIDTNTEDRV
ncbi:MAG TPA: hypothetical protein PLC61_03855 [Chitinophagales bacterium]|nr:hypothetical protein [Chitinophagales bacterium]HMU99010.1 hypothetical protein [Chitinophagales bacterium]HMV03482.1 hypothetical protein [Chitinophagales bacterium]HMW95446.1 hypothetical protein [Chitinophagales bacterium]HMY43279.1 hypothetical protein [Chitinophagales bacterium]